MLTKSVILTSWHIILISIVLGSIEHQTRLSLSLFPVCWQYTDSAVIVWNYVDTLSEDCMEAKLLKENNTTYPWKTTFKALQAFFFFFKKKSCVNFLMMKNISTV